MPFAITLFMRSKTTIRQFAYACGAVLFGGLLLAPRAGVSASTAASAPEFRSDRILIMPRPGVSGAAQPVREVSSEE